MWESDIFGWKLSFYWMQNQMLQRWGKTIVIHYWESEYFLSVSFLIVYNDCQTDNTPIHFPKQHVNLKSWSYRLLVIRPRFRPCCVFTNFYKCHYKWMSERNFWISSNLDWRNSIKILQLELKSFPMSRIKRGKTPDLWYFYEFVAPIKRAHNQDDLNLLLFCCFWLFGENGQSDLKLILLLYFMRDLKIFQFWRQSLGSNYSF